MGWRRRGPALPPGPLPVATPPRNNFFLLEYTMGFKYCFLRILGDKHLPENREERFLRVCHERLKRMAVLSHPGFEIDTHQGYKCHVFGLQVGCNMELEGVTHDLAHIVEFGSSAYRSRATGGGGLRFKERVIWVFNRFCTEPRTGESSLREARTFGIQRRINERLGIKQLWDEYVDDMLGALSHMSDSCYFYKDEDKAKLVKAMTDTYESITDEVIDSRLDSWFTSALRTKRRWKREGWVREPRSATLVQPAALPEPTPPSKELAAA